MVMAGTSLGDPGQCRLEPADGDPARLEAYLPSPCVQNHARVPAQDGGLACVWFGGTQEGPPDISICGARLRRGASGWSAPVRLSDDRGAVTAEANPVSGSGWEALVALGRAGLRQPGPGERPIPRLE